MKTQWLKGNPYHAKDGQDSFFYLFKDDGKLLDSYLTISNLRQLRRGKDIKEGSFYWDKVNAKKCEKSYSFFSLHQTT